MLFLSSISNLKNHSSYLEYHPIAVFIHMWDDEFWKVECFLFLIEMWQFYTARNEWQLSEYPRDLIIF